QESTIERKSTSLVNRLLDIHSVRDLRPKFFPNEGPAELTIMAPHAITGIQRPVIELNGGVALLFANVQTSGPMTALTTGVHKFTASIRANVSRMNSKADRMAWKAFRIRIRFSIDQTLESMGMSGFLPDFCLKPMALHTLFGACISGLRV